MNPRIISSQVYYRVFAALLGLTVLTIGMGFVNLGIANVLVAVTIAVIKAALVILFFMHVKYSSHVTWVFAAGGFVWLVLLIALTLGDVLSRGWLPGPSAW